MRRWRQPGAFAALAALQVFSPIAGAMTWDADPQNYVMLLRRLQPGDVLRLSAGRYAQGLRLHDLHGAPGRPIVIAGPKQAAPAIFTGSRERNTVSIANASHIEVRDLVLDGGGLEVDAVKAEGRPGLVHHITLERLTIIGHGPHQQTVGISTQAPAAFWTIRDNLIIGAGTGMYLGGYDGSAPFVSGVIEGNRILASTGYNIQIKHQAPRPRLEGLPEAESRTIIRGNVFAKAVGSSTGPMARPNLLLGHFPREGAGIDDEYRVEQNVFYGNPAEALLQAEGNVVVEDNLFVNPDGDGVAIQPHNDVPRKIRIRDNFIAAKGFGLRVVDPHPRYGAVVDGNQVYAAVPTSGVGGGNITGPAEAAAGALRGWLESRPGAQARATSALLQALGSACGMQRARGPDTRSFRVIPSHEPACDLIGGKVRGP